MMQTGLIALDVVGKVSRVDLDLRAAVRESGVVSQELSTEELLRIAHRLKFKAKVKHLPVLKVAQKYPLPAIACRTDGGFVTLLKIDTEKATALVFLPAERKTGEIPIAELDSMCDRTYIVLSHRQSQSQAAFGFAWFYTEIVKYKKIIAEVMLGSFMVQLFGLISPLFTQVILDKVIVHRTLSTLDILSIAFIFTTVFELLFNLVRNYSFVHTANKIDAVLGSKLFRHLFALPFGYFESRRVGVTVARVKELDNIREFITSKSVSVLIDLLFSSVFLVMMLLYSPPLACVVLAFVAVVSLLYVVVTPELRSRLQAKFQMAAQSQSYLVEAITGIRTVKSLAIEGAMQRKWEDALGNYLRSSFNLSSMSVVAGAISNACQKMMTIAILYIGVRMVIENQISVGMLIAFQMYANQFTNPVLRLVNLWNEFQQTLLAVDRLGDILHHPVEVHSEKAITLPKLAGQVIFERVGFKYTADGPDVLKNVSFTVNAGSSLGLVGRSGSGKSTVASLVQRLYMAGDGAILIDGVDVRHVNPMWLRQNIGIVLQDSYLFTGSIRDNISMPRPDASMEHIIEAAKIAGAHDFISEFPQGYDTEVGERGSTLSGGQRQRIAIARALITNPRILIFDEATSALDYESERVIQQNLERIKKGRTFIVIAHRLSAVRSCDQIVVLDRGSVVENGSHNDLIGKNNGAYRHLHQQQVALNAVT
jgi:subfamily B ATP-binding cassette protein HlyB/CyaB